MSRGAILIGDVAEQQVIFRNLSGEIDDGYKDLDYGREIYAQSLPQRSLALDTLISIFTCWNALTVGIGLSIGLCIFPFIVAYVKAYLLARQKPPTEEVVHNFTQLLMKDEGKGLKLKKPVKSAHIFLTRLLKTRIYFDDHLDSLRVKYSISGGLSFFMLMAALGEEIGVKCFGRPPTPWQAIGLINGVVFSTFAILVLYNIASIIPTLDGVAGYNYKMYGAGLPYFSPIKEFEVGIQLIKRLMYEDMVVFSVFSIVGLLFSLIAVAILVRQCTKK